MSYKALVIADNSGEWTGNALRFATSEEAEAYARDLAGRWTIVRQSCVAVSDDPVNYEWVNDRATPIVVYDLKPEEEVK